MREPIYIPEEVKESIAAHVQISVERAREGFLSAAEDEDALTGHLGGVLRTGLRTVRVANDEIRGEWKWSINYVKFRGRGKNATEKILGADGIFFLTVDRGYREETKALLFQAKKDWDEDKLLLQQSVRLSTWREAAIVVNYTAERYEAFNLDDVIRAHGKRSPGTVARDMAETLGRDFPDCLVGDTSLFYDAGRRRLIWRTLSGEIVATDFTLGHKISLKIQAPKRGTREKVDRIVPQEEVHHHRLRATEEEILSLSTVAAPGDLRAKYNKLALAYHPDKFSELDELDRAILTRRMQELNAARDAFVRRKP
jgi:hypothetical protein